MPCTCLVTAENALSSKLTNEEQRAVNPQAHAGMIGRSDRGTLKHENVIQEATSPGMMRALDCDNDGEVAPSRRLRHEARA